MRLVTLAILTCFQVYLFFKERISSQYPPLDDEEMNPWEHSRLQHQSFVKSRCESVLGRDAQLKQVIFGRLISGLIVALLLDSRVHLRSGQRRSLFGVGLSRHGQIVGYGESGRFY